MIKLANLFTVNTSDEPLRKKTKRSSNFFYEIAPGERKKLNDWIREENHDTKAFPELFPDGKNGLHDKSRKRKISPIQNYSHKILNKNKKFSKDPDFVFVAQQYLEKHSFENQISISLQRGVLTNALEGGKEIRSHNAIDVFKVIPGTPPYWKGYRNEIFARMEQLGPFQFFFTLSSAEMHWPEVAVAILHTIGKTVSYEKGWEEDDTKIKIDGISLPKYKKKEWRYRSKAYKDNFLLITRIFDNKVKAFVKFLTATGDVEHYTYRIEFQVRGMPHVHGVFWLKKEIIEKYKTNDEYDDIKVVELIDQWISCSLDTGIEKLDQLVAEVNVHGHTKSCQKGKSFCRFNFPRLPSNETLIAGPLESNLSEEDKEETLLKYNNILDFVKNKLKTLSDEDIDELYNNDLETFLKELDIDYEDYKKALRTSERGKIVIMKRKLKERNVNNYNKEWLLAWKGNLDIQFCYDGYAVVTYLTDYLSKVDAGLTSALKNSLAETKGCNDFKRLNDMKKAYFTHRQVSVAEAAYRLIPGLNLKSSNTKTTFVASGFEENRSKFCRKVQEEGDDDFEYNSDGEEIPSSSENGKELFNLPGRKGKFQITDTIHNKYSNRPDKLETICLAQFATSYEACAKPGKNFELVDGISSIDGTLMEYGTENKLPKYIQLKSGGYMRLRIAPCIMRIHSSKKKKGDEGLYAELLLFFPWRDEKFLRENCIDLFNNNFNVIKENRHHIYPESPMIDTIKELAQNSADVRPVHLSEIDPTGEQENLDDEENCEPIDTTKLPEEEPSAGNIKSTGCLFRQVIVDEHEVMIQYARSLSFEQRIVFDPVIKFCKEVKRLKKGGKGSPKPPQLIVKGKRQIYYYCF